MNISKNSFKFASTMYLEALLENIEKMSQSTFDEIVEKYVEMNIDYPFREGNGRSTRTWLDQIFKTELYKVVNWIRIEKEDYLFIWNEVLLRISKSNIFWKLTNK